MDQQCLERQAARNLNDALGTVAILHHAGQRARYRGLLDRAIRDAERALATAAVVRDAQRAELQTSARSTLAKAHAAKAEDALHGAGQLSLSAQRAPTREACDDGWRRVEAIVLGAEESARIAALMAGQLENDGPASKAARAARIAARKAAGAAESARKLVEERNQAYTFHTDSGFSFGEGWYLAAAAVLAGVAIQIEPNKAGTPQAEQFLRDAGLGGQLQRYRSRPRAMKHTTELVGRAFRADPAAAQRTLRRAFLADEPIPRPVMEWIDGRLPGAHGRQCRGKKVLLWVRDGAHHPNRNTTYPELMELTQRVRDAGLVPILTGDPVPGGHGHLPEAAIDMILFWKDPTFRGPDMRRAQLQFFEHLRGAHDLVGQLGVTTAGMDGPALMGLRTTYLTDAPNVRMREWVGAVPGYRELVRDSGYLDRVSRVLSEWADSAGAAP